MSAGSTTQAHWTPAAVAHLRAWAAARGVHTRSAEPLARHTSMGVGGPCTAMVWPTSDEQLRALCEWMGQRGLAWQVLGGGTNLLVRDAGVPEVVCNTSEMVQPVRWREDRAVLPAGVPTARALRMAAERGLDGLVWAAGLPGTIGGAAAGNAGCWGGEMADVVTALDVIDGEGRAQRLPRAQLGYAYRTLRLPPELPRPLAITAVSVALRPAPAARLVERYRQLQQRKRRSQPVGARNSGCIFRNPEGERSAGALLEAAGCKGLAVGDAVVSSVHANFIVNRGNARCTDVLALIEAMRERVVRAFGIELQTEIRLW